jgi:hypothetical protein
VPFAYIKRVFEVMRRAHWHRFQVVPICRNPVNFGAVLQTLPDVDRGKLARMVVDKERALAAKDGRGARLMVLTDGVVPYLTLAHAGTLPDDLGGLNQADDWSQRQR